MITHSAHAFDATASQIRSIANRRPRPVLSARYDASEAGFSEDAVTDTALITRQLTWLLERKHVLYRPTHFRQFLQVDRQIPAWVEFPVIQKVEGLAKLIPIQQQGAQMPKPNVSVSEKKYRMVQFGCAYDVMDREVQLAAATGMNVSDERVTANNTASEQLLDQIAATGDPFGLSLGGLMNNSDVTIVSGTGTAWASATFAQILSDLNKITNAVAVNSKENFRADTLILPLAQYQLITAVQSSFDHTPLELFLAQNQYIRRVGYWDRAKTAGASSATRAVALDSQTPNGPRMLISQELTEEPALRIPFGTTVNQSMITGGVLLESTTAVAYMDGI